MPPVYPLLPYAYMHRMLICLQVQYMVDQHTATGTCAVCVSKDGSRSLVANLAAANNYKVSSPTPCCLGLGYQQHVRDCCDQAMLCIRYCSSAHVVL